MVNKQGTFEISLESLGLKLSTETPECLPEKKEAESHKSQCMKKNVVSISDAHNNKTGSIVVLGEDLLYKIQTQSLARYKLIYQKSLSVDYKSVISCLTTLELQQKLSDISQENLRLKQALGYNALSMKHALNIIASKQADLVSAHDARKQKVIEIKKMLHIPRKEDAEGDSEIINRSKDFDHASKQTETEEQKYMLTSPMPPAGKCNESKVAGLVKKCEKQDKELVNIHPVSAPSDQQPETSSKNVPQKSEDPPIKFVRLIEELEALGDCCAVNMYSRFTNISEGLHGCRKIVAEKRNAREIGESLRFLESSISAELIYLRSMLIHRMTKNNGQPECKTEFDMEVEKIFSSYNSKLRELKYLREENDLSSKLRINENFDQQNPSATIVSLREPKMSLEEAQLSFQDVKFHLMRQEEEIKCERIRMQSKERQLIEANVNLHEEVDRLRESNNVLRVQLTVYENDWADQKKVCEIMRKKENELLDHIRNLEAEKTQWLTAMQCFQKKHH